MRHKYSVRDVITFMINFVIIILIWFRSVYGHNNLSAAAGILRDKTMDDKLGPRRLGDIVGFFTVAF